VQLRDYILERTTYYHTEVHGKPQRTHMQLFASATQVQNLMKHTLAPLFASQQQLLRQHSAGVSSERRRTREQAGNVGEAATKQARVQVCGLAA
jgi:hypothetical protein